MESIQLLNNYSLDFSAKFHPDHLADLKKSGLSEETIKIAGIYTVPPDRISKILGWNPPQVTSALAFPYPGKDFIRLKVFPPYRDKNGHLVKYLQHKGPLSHLYIPPGVEEVLRDTGSPLYIPEGEKKTLKGSQEGLLCVGLSGLWNWSDGEKNLIPDFDHIALKGRTVYIVPDNDWLQPDKHGHKKNLKQAVYELAERLKARGAKVFIVQLPDGGD